MLAEAFRAFREEGREPIWLYRTLAHAPRMLRAFSATGRGLRRDAVTPRSLRELVIMRTAQLTASEYEWSHHRRMAIAAGLDDARLAALDDWRRSDLFSPVERAALRCTDEVHRAAVTDETFAELHSHLAPAEIVEVVLTAAFYQAVARILQGLGVEVEPAYESDLPGWTA
jgi:alkylhydroperoxidase family enzyme